ncbi:MAG: hypothetical protein AB7E52_03535 [Bdellovibrionales bacterium]
MNLSLPKLSPIHKAFITVAALIPMVAPTAGQAARHQNPDHSWHAPFLTAIMPDGSTVRCGGQPGPHGIEPEPWVNAKSKLTNRNGVWSKDTLTYAGRGIVISSRTELADGPSSLPWATELTLMQAEEPTLIRAKGTPQISTDGVFGLDPYKNISTEKVIAPYQHKRMLDGWYELNDTCQMLWAAYGPEISRENRWNEAVARPVYDSMEDRAATILDAEAAQEFKQGNPIAQPPRLPPEITAQGYSFDAPYFSGPYQTAHGTHNGNPVTIQCGANEDETGNLIYTNLTVWRLSEDKGNGNLHTIESGGYRATTVTDTLFSQNGRVFSTGTVLMGGNLYGATGESVPFEDRQWGVSSMGRRTTSDQTPADVLAEKQVATMICYTLERTPTAGQPGTATQRHIVEAAQEARSDVILRINKTYEAQMGTGPYQNTPPSHPKIINGINTFFGTGLK